MQKMHSETYRSLKKLSKEKREKHLKAMINMHEMMIQLERQQYRPEKSNASNDMDLGSNTSSIPPDSEIDKAIPENKM